MARLYNRALNRLKLRQLSLLVTVGRLGNIQAAAQAENISQPAATRMVKDLEADFDTQLFERTNRGVIPTAQGAALIRHAQLIFTQLSNATQEMEDITEGSAGRIVVGTLLAGAAQLVPMAVQRVLSERPNVTIRIMEGTNDALMPRVQTGEVDMVVGRLPHHRHRKGLMQVPLIHDDVVLVVGRNHPLAGRADLTFDDLRPYGWILPPPETTLRRQMDEVFVEAAQYEPPKVVESVNYLSNRTLLGAGELIGLVPRTVAALDMALNVLTRLDYALPFGSGPIGVTHRGDDQLSPAALLFLLALQEEAEVLNRGRAASS
ncbi:LysR substrate-binding domain-containing protein [Gymnodinialimonas hymeniacidonis]|uniref:LysR substrate-binding domain-containing protein n=1 Tax=Gymnodinialimonas hymeniacidonis TaxID=3126508 RepID=UPI0034C60E07